MRSSNQQSLVSIIIGTYNYGEFIEKAIDSCLAQTHRSLEIIVVDDGSTDNTAKLIADKYDGKVTYIYQENRGVAAARNAGLEIAKGEFVAFLDSDDYLLPDAIEQRLAPFESDDELCMVITQIYSLRENQSKLKYRAKFKDDLVSDKLCEMMLSNKLNIPPSCMLMRMTMARRFKFPEDLTNGEDIAFFVKNLFGCRGCLLAKPTVVMYKHAKSLRNDIEKIKKQKLALVATIFDDPYYGGAIEYLRAGYMSSRYLSLSRSMYCGGYKKLARKYYMRAISLKPSNMLKVSYLKKFLRCWI